MFSTNDVLTATKAGVAQLIAKGYMDAETPELTALDDQFIVDLGETIQVQDGEITTNSPADIFFKALISQVGRIYVDTKSYRAQLPSLFVDPMEWGLVAEYIEIDISDVMIDEIWNPNGYINWSEPGGPAEGARIAAIEYGCYKPAVRAKVYRKATGIMAALTIGDGDQLFTAFQNAGQYNSFVAGLYNSISNTIQLKAELYALMTVSMMIAAAKANNNEINVLAEYKTAKPDSTITAATALQNGDFLRFLARRTADLKDNMQRFTALYNNHEHITFSTDTNVIMLAQVANAIKFNMYADTFHKDLVSIGNFDTVVAWQAAKTSSADTAYNFKSASSISITAEAAEEVGLDAQATVIDGVVAVIYDRRAAGITIDKRKTTSKPCASRATTNYFYHSLVNYIVNTSQPIVTLVIRD